MAMQHCHLDSNEKPSADVKNSNNDNFKTLENNRLNVIDWLIIKWN